MDGGSVARDANGALRLGPGLLDLGSSVEGGLQRAAVPYMTWLAERLDATVAMSVAEGGDAVCLMSVEPPSSSLHVALRPGFR
ncbi:hypothetical protein [Spongiactinospora sp. TRM90649]|uniref:hypothetical protein n=1 Tax=Spongiactinospora sp. TRM90649 TaxID=3031114 RepID=UPI0023F7FFB9|nr:hypothetical protein [Spongiactinospora sp. TRM90649]MDF5757460.1 hypothetical protein [Spongiactinospora sp. TRM90649]